MRVLMLGQFPPSPSRIDGGVAAAMTYLCQALVQLRDVELIGVRLAPGGPGKGEEGAFAWPVLDLPLDRFSVSTLFWKQKREFKSLVERCRPDVVHAQGADAAGLIAVDCGVPAVVTVHGVLGECANYQTNPLVRARARFSNFLTERPTLRTATDVIAISPYVVRHYGDEIRGNVHAIPNAVAPGFFDVRRAPERGRFLFAGRISKLKGVLELVQAVAACRDSVRCLVLAGATADPVYESEVRQSISQAGLDDRIRFAGLLDEPALLEEFARAEALVLPSYQETAPMVVQQAMAAGLPVIATRVGGVPYQIKDDETGLLVEAGATDELAQALSRFDGNPALGARLGTAARNSASMAYDAGAVARATYEVYRDMLLGASERRSVGASTA
jgi:glycosyltransferase involved in cell wall biosynthesis